MSETISNYRIYCETESAYVYKWSDQAPTSCPNDASHTIDSSSTTIVQTLGQNKVIIQDGTPGYYQSTSVTIDIANGTPGDIATKDIIFPFDVQLWTTCLMPNNASEGDNFNVIVAPDKVVSILTATGNIGDVVLHLHPSIFNLNVLVKGCYIKLFNGVSVLQDVGRITAIDSTTNTITVETALTSVFNAGSPVMINLYLVRDFNIPNMSNNLVFGSKGINTKHIPANTTIKFYYKNNSGTAKKVTFMIEYNYF